MSQVVEYVRKLIAFDSTSRLPNVEISDWVESQLRSLGFESERIEHTDRSGTGKVSVVAKRGTGRGGMAYFGHSDCVPVEGWTGPAGAWTGTVSGDRLYGRGACDMKGSVAAMLEAARRTRDLPHTAPLYFVCTADEETGYLGAEAVAERSRLFREMVAGGTFGVIGEPTRLEVVHAHKGGSGFRVTSHGRAAHSSTSLGVNANVALIPFLVEMRAIYEETLECSKWQDPNFDPPVLSWNIGITDGGTALNITVPRSTCTVFFRPMPGVDHRPLLDRARDAANRCGLEFEWLFDGAWLNTDPQSRIVQELLEITGQSHPRRVAYGTDACKFPELEQLVVFGPGDIAQAHTDEEWIALEQLERGVDYYSTLIRRWCG